MAYQDVLKKDLNIPYIDEDAENISSDEDVTKEIVQQKETLCMESSKDGRPSLEMHSDKQVSIPSSQHCIIDMPVADEVIGASLNFGLTSKVAKENTQENHVTELIEMHNLSSVTPSAVSTWKSVDNESATTNSPTVEILKKVKKKKRHKPKGAGDQQDMTKEVEEKKEALNDNESLASSIKKLERSGTSDWPKKLEHQKSADSESQPLLGTDTIGNKGNGGGSKSLKKRASKTLSAKKDALNDPISQSVNASQSSNQPSKDKQGKTNKNEEEDVEEIMKKHGLFDSSTTNKKKSKDNKHNLPKKSKKKLKKTKKEDKQKDKESSEQTETEPTERLEQTLIDTLQDDSVFCVSGEVLTKDSSEEFVTQGRRKATPKQPISGRESPKTIGTRKRRFSDPSPSANKSPNGTFANSQRSFHNRKANSHLNDKKHDNTFAVAEALCDRESQLQWPTLPSFVDSANCKSTTRQSTTSYAGKLRSNLDSTGCSLASSSEDGSSTASSSSNNYSSCSAEQISPDGEHHAAAIPFFIGAAAAQLIKDTRPAADSPSPTVRDQTKPSPTSIANKVVGHAKGEENSSVVSVCVESEVNQPNNAALSFLKQGCSSNTFAVSNVDVLLPIEPKTKAVVLNDEFEFESNENNEIIFEFMTDIDTTTSSDVKVMSELENEWGLKFFTDDFSRDKLDNNEQMYNEIVESRNTMVHVTFAADKFIFNGTVSESALSNQSKPKSKTSSATFSLPLVNMRVDGPRTAWNDPGDFDLKKATNVLLQEWNTAVAKGHYYGEE